MHQPHAHVSISALQKALRGSVILLALMLPVPVGAQPAAPAGAPPPAVVTLTVHPQEITRASEFIGHVQAIQSVDVHAQVAGILQRVAFDGGQDVKQGALLYQIEPAQYQAALAAAQAQLQSAQASLVQAQQNLARQQSLFQHQTTAEATLEQAQAQRDVAQANALAAQAQVQTAKINAGYTTINAPIAGRVGATKVTAGNLVGPTTGTLTTVVQLDPIRVVFSVNERALVAYKQRHPDATQEQINARFVPKLRLPDGSMFAQSGRVAFVENQVDPTTGTLPVYADFPNPQDMLLPGMLVTAVISPETPPMGFLVPAGAVGQDAQGKFVLVVGTDSKIERRNVDANDQIEQSIAITKGLQDGDRVVIEGGQKVKPGQIVRPIEEGARTQGNARSASAQTPAQGTQTNGGAPPTPTAQSPAPNVTVSRPSNTSGGNGQTGRPAR
jgi:membrane fusion protein, multidrug efflux system